MEYPRFIMAVLLFSISMFATPGPNNATIMAVGLSRGFRAALPHILAVTIGGPLMLLGLGAGLGELFTRYPLLNECLKYMGSVYMLWLAWRISGLGSLGTQKTAATDPKDVSMVTDGTSPAESQVAGTALAAATNDGSAAKGISDAGAVRPLNFVQGLLFQLVNPKAWLTCVSALGMYVGSDAFVWRRIMIICAIFVIIGFLSVSMWAAGGVLMSRFLTSEGMRRCNYVFAAFLALSVALLFVG